MTSVDYNNAAIKNVEEKLKRSGKRLPTLHIDTPMNITYSPESNVTVELNDDDTIYFQELMRVLR